jgi:hypothetical protein
MANGLINLQTDLKSLKYGSMPLGSDKPYVTKNIGQSPGSQIGLQSSHRIDDVSRIAQMLVGKPGLKYLANEALLQQVNAADKIKKAQQGGKSLVGAVLQQAGSTLLTTVKIVGSTLAQVPVNGTGTHFLKGFRTDTYLQPSGPGNISAFASFFGAGGVEGAPLALEGKPITGVAKQTNFGTEENGNFKIDPNISTKYGYDSKVRNGKELKDYDESKNRVLPIEQYDNAKAYAKLGKVVPIDSGSFSSKDPLVKTKLQQSKAGDNQIGTIEILQAGSPTALGGKPLFDYKSTATGTSTEDAIRNAQAGAPIRVAPSGSIQKDTSVTSTTQDKLIQSITNQGTTPTLGDNGNNQISRSYSDTVANSYAKSTSTDNIGRALGGSDIPTGGTIAKNEIVHKYSSIQSANTAAEKQHKSQPNEDLGKEYTDKSTYSQEQANRVIGTSKKPTQKETRVGLGDQAKTTKANINYWTPANPLEIDQINALDISSTRKDGAAASRDLAKFYFEIITPEGSNFLYFRAHIKSVDDSFGADWQARKYVGRAENFYTYGGFDRDINVSFTIAAATRTEMRPLYRKMVYLASATAPTYGTSGLMRGTLARMTVGSYIDQIPGVITSVKFTVDNNVPWEIAMGQPEGVEEDVQVLPMVMECSISFKPIHDFAPQTGLHHFFTNSHQGPKFFEPGEAIE